MLRVIGAGLGRTGTESLKLALERLLNAPCYHMTEVFENISHIPLWRQAARGEQPDWYGMFDKYSAAVDWPAAAFWPELSTAYPDALVILSLRAAEDWWCSASNTIFTDHNPAPDTDWREMWLEVAARRFTGALHDREACIAAYKRHYEQVRRSIAPERLLEWSVREGWGPLCTALDVPVPDAPFPHANTREEFLALLRELSQSG